MKLLSHEIGVMLYSSWLRNRTRALKWMMNRTERCKLRRMTPFIAGIHHACTRDHGIKGYVFMMIFFCLFSFSLLSPLPSSAVIAW